MKLNVLRADPSGNITLFVLDPVPKEERAAIGAHLMSLPGSDVEQVGFVCPPLHGGLSRMEMAGGEFCGNATRAFGMLVSQRSGASSQVLVEVSGCAHPVTVEVDWPAGTARTQMPLPRRTVQAEAGGHTGVLVDLGSIAHLVVEDAPPSLEFFQRAEPLFQELPGLEAYGVMFLNSRKGTITPLVKVPAAGSLVWEGSCGSGALAAAAAQGQNVSDGPFVRSYIQPAGAVEAAVVRRGGRTISAWIGGPVSLASPVAVGL